MSNQTGVLYISYDGMTDNLGQSQVIPYLEKLSAQGYSIHIISSEKPQMFEKRKTVIQKLLDKSGIVWHPIPYTAKPAVVSTMYDLHCMEQKAREIIKNKANNICLLHCRSYISAHVGLYCQQEFRIPWIFDMRGFFADERVEGGLWRLSNPLYKMVYRYFKQVEKKCIAQAAHIVSLTYNGANEIRSWRVHQVAQTPISVIPCCTDMKLFQFEKVKSSREDLRKKLQIDDSAFVLSYLGSFGTWYMTDEMFDFFKVVYDKNPKAIFLCITPDSPDKLESLAMRKDIPRSALRVCRANREDVPAYAALSDWSLFFIKPVYSKKASSPTKMGELLSLGVPLVCNGGVGDVDSIMAECSQGFVVQEFTTLEYARVADGVLQSSAPNRDSLRATAEIYFSLEKGAQQYASIYKTIIENK